jgi:L-ascorbate metabolism protein UlaG (beta-lactamase superfamily)
MSRTVLLMIFLAAGGCGSRGAGTDAGAASATSNAAHGEATTSATPAPHDALKGPEVLDTQGGKLEVHPVHHATVWLDAGGTIVWIDPWTEGDLAGPKADLILVTHEHFDHFDPKGIEKVSKAGTKIIGPGSLAEKIPGLVVMKNGEHRDEGPIGIDAVPAYNKERGPEPGKLYHPKGRDNGYVLSFGGKRVYFSGDTECTDEMKALTNLDLAFVCMNLPYTMPTAEAAACVKAMKPKVLVPYHYRGQRLDDLDEPLAGSGIAVHKHALY